MFRQILAAIPADYSKDLGKITGGILRGTSEPEALSAARQALARIEAVVKLLEAIRIEYDVGKDTLFDGHTLALDVAVEGVGRFLDSPIGDKRKQAEAEIFKEAIRELLANTHAWARDLVNSKGAPNTADEEFGPVG